MIKGEIVFLFKVDLAIHDVAFPTDDGQWKEIDGYEDKHFEEFTYPWCQNALKNHYATQVIDQRTIKVSPMEGVKNPWKGIF